MDRSLLERTLADLGEPGYRAAQAVRAHGRGGRGYEELTTWPAALRSRVAAAVPWSTLAADRRQESRDGTVKVSWRTADARPLESVLMRYRDGRRTVCVSSQSGCPLTCRFCATGTMAFGRNLTAAEIVDQVAAFNADLAPGGERVTNVVFMGMGEPFLNYDSVIAAARALNDPQATGIAARQIAISTVGWVPGIRRLAEEPLQLHLALSLHAADDALRSELMPVNDRYPLREVLAACREYLARRRRRIFVEVCLMDGVNDGPEHARAMAAVLAGGGFAVNAIPHNPTGLGFEPSPPERVHAFVRALRARGVPATVRHTFGRDISAACGQLVTAGARPDRRHAASSSGSVTRNVEPKPSTDSAVAAPP